MEIAPVPKKPLLKWILVLCSAAGITTSANSQELVGGEITLDRRVVSQIIPHIASQAVTQMPPLEQRLSVVAKGNFGRAVEINSKIKMRQLDSGLYEVREHSSGVQGSGSQGQGTAISLCGLVNVVSGGKSHNVTNVSGIAGAFIQEWRFYSDSTTSYKIVNLESTAPSLCNIAPGTNFTYRINGTGALHMKRQFLSDKTIEITASSKNECAASESKKPAQDLDPQLVGDYIEVSCEMIDGKGHRFLSTRAYLIEYHYYLTLKTKTESARSELTYAVREPAMPAP